MRLSLVQITVGPQIDKNFQKVDKFINQALSFDPDLILLPECFLFLSNLKKTSLTSKVFRAHHASYLKRFIISLHVFYNSEQMSLLFKKKEKGY